MAFIVTSLYAMQPLLMLKIVAALLVPGGRELEDGSARARRSLATL